ncbi:MAG: shikimate kinase [Eubacteriales bacterium]|nr:shikimate kinase [Eubacteriales bacterium]
MITLFLIGFMGCGKSTIAKILSNDLKLNLVDTNNEIEIEEKSTIQKIIEAKGDLYLQKKESELLKKISNRFMVVSLGDGFTKNIEIANRIKSISRIIFLDANAKTVMNNLKNNYKEKPYIYNNFDEEYIQKMIDERKPMYEYMSNASIKVDNTSIDDVILQVLNYYNNWNKAEVYLKIC